MKIGLLGCVKTKLPHAASARDLYISPLFEGTVPRCCVRRLQRFATLEERVLRPSAFTRGSWHREVNPVRLRKGTKALEREANAFAASLLMPELHFDSMIETRPFDETAKHFGVSTPAVAWRLYNAGLGDRPPEDDERL